MVLPGVSARGYVGVEATAGEGSEGSRKSTLPAGPNVVVLVEMGSTLVLMLTPWLFIHGMVNCSRTLAMEKPARNTDPPARPSSHPSGPLPLGSTQAMPTVGEGKWTAE